jgi:hypothetical protein
MWRFTETRCARRNSLSRAVCRCYYYSWHNAAYLHILIFLLLSVCGWRQSEKQQLQEQVNALRAQLTSWPPPQCPYVPDTPSQHDLTDTSESSSSFRSMVRGAAEAPAPSSLPLTYIRHEVSRLSFSPPEPLFDLLGNPLRRTFDAMISYQVSSLQLLVCNHVSYHTLLSYRGCAYISVNHQH